MYTKKQLQNEAKTGRAKRNRLVIVGDINASLSPIDRSAREKIKDIEELHTVE